MEQAATAERLAVLNEIGRELLVAESTAAAYAVLRRGAVRLAAPDVFMVGVIYPDGKRLRIRYLVEGDVEYPRVTRSPLPPLFQRLLDTADTLVLPSREAILEASGTDVWRLGDPSPLAYSATYLPMLIAQRLLGVLGVQSYVPDAFDSVTVECLAALANLAAAVERAALWRSRAQTAAEAARGEVRRPAAAGRSAPGQPAIAPATTLTEPGFGVYETLLDAIDERDSYTRSHAALVTSTALAAAEALNLSDEQRRALYLAGMLLDIGKLGIPEAVLLKPAPLRPDEMALVRQHPIIGATIAGQMANLVRDPALLDQIRAAIRSHHEHWDGTGYPDRLRREQIPFLARLLAVADSYAAMIVDRPYKPALHPQAALADLIAGAGTRYDPAIVDAFVEAQGRQSAARPRHEPRPTAGR